MQVYSITARSLTKEQLRRLKDAGNTTLNDVIRLKPQPNAQSRSSIQLHSGGGGGGSEAGSEPHSPRQSQSQFAEPGSSSPSSSHSPRQSQSQLAPSRSKQRSPSPIPTPRKTTATLNLSLQSTPASVSGGGSERQIRPAASQRKGSEQYQVELDPSHEPVLIYPDQDRGGSEEGYATPASNTTTRHTKHTGISHSSATSNAHAKGRAPPPPSGEAAGEAIAMATPKIRSGCISARAAFWERRIMQQEATDTNVEEDFPEMVVPQDEQ